MTHYYLWQLNLSRKEATAESGSDVKTTVFNNITVPFIMNNITVTFIAVIETYTYIYCVSVTETETIRTYKQWLIMNNITVTFIAVIETYYTYIYCASVTETDYTYLQWHFIPQ